MKWQDWSIPVVIGEAVDILSLIAYIGLQIYYGSAYHVPWYLVGINLLTACLIYAALTWLAVYPERINRLSKEICRGEVRKLSLRMVRLDKMVFLVSLLAPGICDVAGREVPGIYNAGIIILLVMIAVYYEVRILIILKKQE